MHIRHEPGVLGQETQECLNGDQDCPSEISQDWRTLVDKWPVILWMNQEPTNGDWLPKGDKFYKYYKDKSFADWLFEDIFGWFQDDSLWLMIYLDLMDLDLMDVRFLIWESWVYFCNSEQWGFLGTWVIMPLS